MTLPEIPGIIDALMTIGYDPDGRLSFRVLIGAEDGASRHCDLIELIVGAEEVHRALAGADIVAPADSSADRGQPTVPCRIGLYRDASGAVA